MVKMCPKCGVINENDFVCCKNCGETIGEISILPVEKMGLKRRINKKFVFV